MQKQLQEIKEKTSCHEERLETLAKPEEKEAKLAKLGGQKLFKQHLIYIYIVIFFVIL